MIQKVRMKRGIGEMIGMAVTLPLVIIMILFIINLFQIAACEQKLIYASYFVGRAAVVSSNSETAQNEINSLIKNIFPGDSSAKGEIIGGDSMAWTKGNIALISVSTELNPVMGIQKGVHSRQIALMIEHSDWIND